jgi:heat shock protein HtpX
MYFMDLFKRMFRKANFSVLLYLALNVFIIGFTVWYLAAHPIGSALEFPLWEPLQLPAWQTFGAGIALYAGSLAIALSPLGEWILRVQTGCKLIKREEHTAFLEPIFKEVMEQAKKDYPMLPDNVHIFLCSDSAPNAFAIGRRTICITEGMLHMPEEQIKAALAHECSHLAHHDTDLILLVSVGNLVVSGLLAAIRALLYVFHLGMSLVSSILRIAGSLNIALAFITGVFNVVISLMNIIYNVICKYVLTGFSWVWTKLGVVLVLNSGKEKEFEADAGAFNMGYGEALCQLLDQNMCAEKPQGLFANLAGSHPDKNERIARLQQLGVTYHSVCGN